MENVTWHPSANENAAIYEPTYEEAVLFKSVNESTPDLDQCCQLEASVGHDPDLDSMLYSEGVSGPGNLSQGEETVNWSTVLFQPTHQQQDFFQQIFLLLNLYYTPTLIILGKAFLSYMYICMHSGSGTMT